MYLISPQFVSSVVLMKVFGNRLHVRSCRREGNLPFCVRIMLRVGMTQDDVYMNMQDSLSCTEAEKGEFIR
jgi:hypothetical protein